MRTLMTSAVTMADHQLARRISENDQLRGMMMYEADQTKREAWIASIDTIARLNPKIVVAGHKSVGAKDSPKDLAASQRYLRDFTAVAQKSDEVDDLVHGMPSGPM